MIDAIILAGFAGWLVVTALLQLNIAPLNRMEWYGFVPNCWFFSPDPVITDVGAYFATSEEATSAREALVWRPLVESDLPRVLPLWNPEHRLQKSLLNLTLHLALTRETVPPSGAHYTVPYLRLLNLATSASNGSTEAFTRFIVTRHRGRASADRQILFESRAHAL
jgi:hypothetical protein